MSTIFVIEDEPIMAECIALAAESVVQTAPDGTVVHPLVETFSDAVLAIRAFAEHLPDVILLDVMLNGPNGFAFLHEIMSYSDTARIPVILITSLNLSAQDLSEYGVIQVLDKATMTPPQIQAAIRAVIPPTAPAPASPDDDALTLSGSANQALPNPTTQVSPDSASIADHSVDSDQSYAG